MLLKNLLKLQTSMAIYASFALRWFLLLLVQLYQLVLGGQMGGSCRFHPSCSNYAIEALKLHPPLKAIFLIFNRIWKCRPGSTYGFDPVPSRGDEQHV